ncbi:unnamed protein product [Amoebophrya sp. A120]|nr:unnamed protein product [Amoebophrya sp. A120]|eukprot:GSA120T00024795001.1
MRRKYALQVCTLNMHCKHVLQICIANMHCKYALRICIANMHCRYAMCSGASAATGSSKRSRISVLSSTPNVLRLSGPHTSTSRPPRAKSADTWARRAGAPAPATEQTARILPEHNEGGDATEDARMRRGQNSAPAGSVGHSASFWRWKRQRSVARQLSSTDVLPGNPIPTSRLPSTSSLQRPSVRSVTSRLSSVVRGASSFRRTVLLPAEQHVEDVSACVLAHEYVDIFQDFVWFYRDTLFTRYQVRAMVRIFTSLAWIFIPAVAFLTDIRHYPGFSTDLVTNVVYPVSFFCYDCSEWITLTFFFFFADAEAKHRFTSLFNSAFKQKTSDLRLVCMLLAVFFAVLCFGTRWNPRNLRLLRADTGIADLSWADVQNVCAEAWAR